MLTQTGLVDGTEMSMSLRHHGQISVSLHRHVTPNMQGDCSYTAVRRMLSITRSATMWSTICSISRLSQFSQDHVHRGPTHMANARYSPLHHTKVGVCS